jgi:2-methylcitrate dehydratase PrpD
MDNRALDDSCRLAAALVADIGDTHAANWLITSAVVLAAVLAVSDQSRDSGRCRGRLVRGQRKTLTQP